MPGMPIVAGGLARRTATASDPYECFLRARQFGALDGVRAVCCLAVIKIHVAWQFPRPRLVGELNGLGVNMFFVISGFLIVTLLMRERRRRGTVNLRRFYARRTLRIFPIYYLLIGAAFASYLAVSPWAPNGLEYYRWTFPVLLTYTQDLIPVHLGNFYQCWTLAMEEQFYLVWPAIEKFATRSGRWIILGGMIVANVLLGSGAFDGALRRIYHTTNVGDRAIFYTTFTPILLGVLLAYLLDDRRTFSFLHRVAGHRASPFIFLGLLVAACDVLPTSLRGWPHVVIHLLFMLLVASLVVREDHFARPILAFPPLVRLGALSYGMYLYHSWVIQLEGSVLHRLGFDTIHPIAMFVIVVAGTVAVAELSYRVVEAPLLRLKERFDDGHESGTGRICALAGPVPSAGALATDPGCQ